MQRTVEKENVVAEKTSFRKLRPGKLSDAILALCREIVREHDRQSSVEEKND